MSNAIIKTDFNFPGQKAVYKGKVRDVYTLENDILVMVASDRISALITSCQKEFLTKVKF